MEEERRSFNPANPVQIDPNETLRIPIEFQQHPAPPFQSKTRSSNRGNVQFSPFINRTPVNARESRGHFVPPPDSPLIHASGRLSLKSPSINNNNNNYQNSYNYALNSPYPGQLRSKQPRPVIRRP